MEHRKEKCEIIKEERLTTKDGIKVRLLFTKNMSLPKEVLENPRNVVNVHFIKVGDKITILNP